jgi:hypothetical protein
MHAPAGCSAPSGRALWAKQEDVEKARLLEQVWAVTIDDLIT